MYLANFNLIIAAGDATLDYHCTSSLDAKQSKNQVEAITHMISGADHLRNYVEHNKSRV